MTKLLFIILTILINSKLYASVELFKKIINYEALTEEFLASEKESINAYLDSEVIELLEKQNVKCKQFKAFTPLMLAVKLRSLDEVKKLVTYDADINQTTNINGFLHTAVSLAFFNNKSDIWRYFVSLKISETNKEITKKILDNSRLKHLKKELN